MQMLNSLSLTIENIVSNGTIRNTQNYTSVSFPTQNREIKYCYLFPPSKVSYLFGKCTITSNHLLYAIVLIHK